MKAQVLHEVKVSNEDLMLLRKLHVPTTVSVTYRDCMKALLDRKVRPYTREPQVTMSKRTTASAINFFAQDPKRVVCALNFASGRDDRVGGEYGLAMPGDDCDNQEEDLCRRIPNLYPSLYASSRRDRREPGGPCYPFGPVTCENLEEVNKYCDVLFTPHMEARDTRGAVLSRGPASDGFPVEPEGQCRGCCIVSAAPPMIRKMSTHKETASSVMDTKLLFQTVTSMFVAPVLKEPRCTTLVLGAWGCGSRCSNNPVQIAQLFSQAIVRSLPALELCLGNLYHEIHFAIPETEGEDKNNYHIFKNILEGQGIRIDVV